MDQQPQGRKAIYAAATQACFVGLVVNLALGAVKLAGGLISGSFALISDAINSLGDVFTSIVVLWGLRYAQRPPDREHPYGHPRAEAVAASSVAVMVIASAGAVAWEAIQRFNLMHELPPAWTMAIAAGCIATKETLYQYKSRVGKRTGSSALIANAWDHRSDAFCSLAVLVGLAVVYFGGTSWIWADEAAAILVAGIIIVTGLKLFKASLSELLDVQADQELLDKVREIASGIQGVAGVEKLWLRKAGLEYFADLHLEVPGTISVQEGHRIGHEVKDRLMALLPMIRDVMVHLEPHGGVKGIGTQANAGQCA